MNCTYLEPEQIIDQGVALLVGGKMTFPGLTVRDNLRVGGHILRRDRARAAAALDEAMDAFPELETRLDQPAGTLSGGEQQMLALARVMMTRPRLLLIDELALGLAPMTVERLMGMVRRINEEGTTVILVEQSVNRAMSLAERCFFLERGEIRFDGPTAELLAARRPPAARSSSARPSTGLELGDRRVAGLSAPNFVLLQGVIIGLGYGLLAVGPRPHLPHQPGASTSPRARSASSPPCSWSSCTADFHFDYWFALALSIALAAAVGALSELVLRRLFTRPRVLVMVATIGLSQVLLALDRAALHPAPQPLQAGAGPLRPLVHPRVGHLHPGRGPHPDCGADRGHRPGRGRALHDVGPRPCGPCRRTPIRPGFPGCGYAGPPP